MAKTKHGIALRHLNTLLNVGAVGGLTDAQLLELFTTGRDEAAELAFTVLVDRHGPMVLRVCQAVLRDSHDAQTPSRPRSWSWSRRPGDCGCESRSDPGSIRSPTGSRPARGRPRPGDGDTSSTQPRRRLIF